MSLYPSLEDMAVGQMIHVSISRDIILKDILKDILKKLLITVNF
jgi:syntenin-1